MHAHHRKHLEASAITPEVIAARGYRSIATRAELARLGFTGSQQIVPAILIPIHGATGDLVGRLLRPDLPRMKRGKVVKYEIPSGARMALDVPSGARPKIGDPKVPLFITEGAKKADAAVSKGLCCLSLIGVWNWRGTNDEGGKVVLADFEHVALNDRETYIVYDSDVMVKESVHEAMTRLAEVLRRRGAKVRFVYLPAGEAGTKVGLDDFFAQRKSVDDLLRLASTELIKPVADVLRPAIPYEEADGGLVYYPQGGAAIRLTNFTARIVAEVVHDDGAEQTREFEMVARCGERRAEFALSPSAFKACEWPLERIGHHAVIHPGNGAERHVAVAIQLLSSEQIVVRTVYTHSGWRKVDGRWLYLHGDGAIGADGLVEGVLVELPDSLAAFRLADPPRGARLVEAVRAELRLLDLGPVRVTAPMWAGVWRSVVSAADFTLYFDGETGAFKTELAALMQQHFGAGFSSRNLPSGWTSTANSQEALLFAAKDAVLVVDDAAPGGTPQEQARLHGHMDRLLRAQGNSAGRQRCRADGSLRPSRPPRGLMVVTAEDKPRIRSGRARAVIVEIARGEISPQRLTSAQRDAADGVYAATTAAFLRWLAGRRDTVLAGWTERVASIRARLVDVGGHPRAPSNLAELAVTADLYLEYAESVGALTTAGRDAVRRRVWDGLVECGRAQARGVQDAEPTTQFRRYLASAMATGRAHVADTDGNAPAVTPQAWGWRSVQGANGVARWDAQGDRIGWIGDGVLYLDLMAAYRVAQAFATSVQSTLAVEPDTLKKRLRERGLLLKTDREHFEPKAAIEGRRPRVLYVQLDFLTSSQELGQLGQEPLSPSQPSGYAAPVTGAELGPVGPPGRPPGEEEVAPGDVVTAATSASKEGSAASSAVRRKRVRL